jgi:glucan biosynthesis protein C
LLGTPDVAHQNPIQVTQSPSIRRHDLDWLRLIAILILLFYHTGMWFNTWGWHVKNSDTSVAFNYWMVWLHFWRMPLLLFISGAGTYMALGKRSPREFARERFRRLFIPLVFGMFVIVPPQIYYEHIDEYSGYWDFYKTVFEIVPYPKGSFSWHHLWFILYLLIYSLLLIPFLNYIRSPRSQALRNLAAKWMTPAAGMIFFPILVLFTTQLVLRPYFPEETHDLTDLAFFVYYMCFFLFGMLFYSEPRLWDAAGANRNRLLAWALANLALFYFMYLNLRGEVKLPWSEDISETIFDILGIFLSWSVLITVIGFGQRFLNRYHPLLKYVNESLYPFYILHQTVIIAIGYYICQLDWSIAAKFWTISFLTLITCVGIYFLIIRPVKFIRPLFGLKPVKSMHQHAIPTQ